MKKIPIIINKENNIFWTVVLFGLLLRLYHITVPFTDYATQLQTTLADTARTFLYNNNFNILEPFRYRLTEAGKPLIDIAFPLTQYLTSIFYRVLGLSEWVARLVPLSFWVGSMVLLRRLLRKYYNARTALFSILFFAIAPQNIFISRAFMPESAMIFFTIGMIYYFSEWIDKDSALNFIKSAIFLTMAVLVKPVTLFMTLPLVLLSFQKYKWKIFIKWKLYLLLLLSLGSLALWQRHLLMIGGRNALETINAPYLQYIFNFDFWLRMYTSITMVILTPLGFILCLAGALLKVKIKEEYIFYAWISGAIIFIVSFPHLHYVHYYYQVVLTPPAALFVGKALNFIIESNFSGKLITSRYLSTGKLALVIILVILISAIVIILPQYNLSPKSPIAGRSVDELTEADALVIAGIGFDNGLLYYTNRKGWLTYCEESVEEINNLRAKGAQYYVTTHLNKERKDKDLLNYLTRNYKIVSQTENYIIYDLQDGI